MKPDKGISIGSCTWATYLFLHLFGAFAQFSFEFRPPVHFSLVWRFLFDGAAHNLFIVRLLFLHKRHCIYYVTTTTCRMIAHFISPSGRRKFCAVRKFFNRCNRDLLFLPRNNLACRCILSCRKFEKLWENRKLIVFPIFIPASFPKRDYAQ